jgi:hypothetical protein
MRTAVRVIVVLAVTVTLTGAGCESNNKGKIEGTKWKGTIKAVPGSSLTMEFLADGRLNLYLFAPPSVRKTIAGKWSLAMGDYVDLTDLSEPLSGRTSHREKIVITNNTLVMTDSDGTSVSFTKTN